MPEPAGDFESAALVKGNRRGLGAADHRDHLPEPEGFAAGAKFGQQRLPDPSSNAVRADVDAVLAGEAISWPVPELLGIGIADDLAAIARHEEWPATPLDPLNLGVRIADRRRLDLVGRGAIEHVMRVDRGDLIGIARRGVADIDQAAPVSLDSSRGSMPAVLNAAAQRSSAGVSNRIA